jgi:NitT/TauT family transport system substrate-binding protein
MDLRGISFAVVVAAVTLASASVAHAADDVSVRLNWFAAGYTAPFYVGVEKGFYKDVGLNVTVQEGQGSGPTLGQVAAGRSTFGFADATALVHAASHGAPVKMVALLAKTDGDCVLVKDASGIKTGADLKGKKYGANAASAIGQLLPAYLQAVGVDDKSVQRVSIDAANLYAGFLGNQFDGMEALDYDEPPRFEAQGVKVSCLVYADKGVRLVGPGIVTSGDMVKNKPDVVRRFVAASLKAYEYSYAHPQETADIAKKVAGKSVENTAVTRKQLMLFSALSPQPIGFANAADWKSSVELLEKYLGIKNVPSTSEMFTNEFLPK